jgi:hypothetical protein
VLTINRSVIGVAYSTEFDIDEIITALKQEIQTANITELGSPNLNIEAVDVVLSVFSTESEKGELYMKIAGFGSEVHYEILNPRSVHNLSFSFQPTGESGFSPEASLGLVEPIKKVKSTLRKAYNTPPSFKIEEFTFRLEFAIEKSMDGGFSFKIIELEDLKAQNITTHQITIHMKIKK